MEHWFYKNHPLEVEFWDTAGQQALQPLRSLAYPGMDIVILGYDTCNPDSLQNVINDWLPEITSVLGVCLTMALLGIVHSSHPRLCAPSAVILSAALLRRFAVIFIR